MLNRVTDPANTDRGLCGLPVMGRLDGYLAGLNPSYQVDQVKMKWGQVRVIVDRDQFPASKQGEVDAMVEWVENAATIQARDGRA